jgi:hypothetical protein
MTDQDKLTARQILRRISQDIMRVERLCMGESSVIVILRQVRKSLEKCERFLL